MSKAPLSLRVLSLLAVVCLPPAPRAQTNLLLNGDSEAGNTSGWIDPLAHGVAVIGAPGAYAGTFSFYAGVNGPTGSWTNELRRDVDVSGIAAMIDAGSVSSVFTCAGRTNAGTRSALGACESSS